MLGYIPNAIIIIPDFCLDHSFPVYIGIQAKQFDKLLLFNSSIIFLAKHIQMLPTRQTPGTKKLLWTVQSYQKSDFFDRVIVFSPALHWRRKNALLSDNASFKNVKVSFRKHSTALVSDWPIDFFPEIFHWMDAIGHIMN